MRKIFTFCIGLAVAAVMLNAQTNNSGFKTVVGQLPCPIYDQHPEFVDLYYKAWELAYERIDTLAGLPAPIYMDEAMPLRRVWLRISI